MVSGQARRPGDRAQRLDAPGVDFHWFPLDNPGLVSIPLSFLLGYLGTVPGKTRPDPAQVARWRSGRSTGADAAKALVH